MNEEEEPIPRCGLKQDPEKILDEAVIGVSNAVRPFLPWECGLVVSLIPPLIGIISYVRGKMRRRQKPLTLRNPVFEPQMMNMDQAFNKKSDADYTVSGEEVVSEVAKITTRDIVSVKSIANQEITDNYFDDVYRIDAKPYVERPFFVGSVQISDTTPRFSLLSTTIKYLPGDVVRSNTSLLNAMKIASLYRSNLTLNISAAGTIGHAGCVLVGVIPPRATYPTGNAALINTLLSGPHGFLNFNEATVVNLEVPWYCNTDYASLDLDNTAGYTPSADFTLVNGNYAMLMMLVINPLSVADGSSKTLDIVVEACFKALDMYVPTPRYITWEAEMDLLAGVGTKLLDFTSGALKQVASDGIDTLRSGIKAETGLHNPNIPYFNNKIITSKNNYYNQVNAGQFFEKLHPFVGERVVNEPIFGSTIDEMNLAHIGSKKQMIGTFSVSTSDGVGKLKWARPISPFQGGFGALNANGVKVVNNIELLHSLFMGWRGKIRIHIQSVMNNKQQVKLKLIKYYNPSLACLTGYPAYSTIVSAPSHLLEYTQGGQEHIVELPYLCRNAITPCAEDMSLEALLHGIYYIYIAQSLVNADGSPVTCEFNVYISLDEDFQWYGYATKSLYPLNYDAAQTTFNKIAFTAVKEKILDSKTKNMTKQEYYKKYVKNQKVFEAFNPHVKDLKWVQNLNTILKIHDKGTVWHPEMKVMNEPQAQTDPIGVVNNNNDNSTRMIPNPDLRSTIRRMYRTFTATVTVGPGAGENAVFPLSSIVGVDTFQPVVSPIYILSRMFYGKSVGYKIVVRLNSVGKDLKEIVPRVHYVTPNMVITSADQLVRKAAVNPAAYPDVFTPGVVDPPVPLLLTPVVEKDNNKIYEFVIPNTTYVKFVGSPDQFADIGAPSSNAATTDSGSFVITLSNLGTESNDLNVEILIGLTDESRMGYQCIAPPFYIDKTQSTYLGSTAGEHMPVSNAVNKYLYKGGFGGL